MQRRYMPWQMRSFMRVFRFVKTCISSYCCLLRTFSLCSILSRLRGAIELLICYHCSAQEVAYGAKNNWGLKQIFCLVEHSLPHLLSSHHRGLHLSIFSVTCYRGVLELQGTDLCFLSGDVSHLQWVQQSGSFSELFSLWLSSFWFWSSTSISNSLLMLSCFQISCRFMFLFL